MKFFVKIVIVLLLCVIWHYLFEDKFSEFSGIWIYLEKVILCCVVYGVHRLVEWVADKKFQLKEDVVVESEIEISREKVKSLMESLEKNQLLFLTEDRSDYCILTLNEDVFNLNIKATDRLAANGILLDVKDKEKEKCSVDLFLTISDSEETLLKESPKEVSQMEVIRKYKIDMYIGEATVQVFKAVKKKNKYQNKYLTFFVYKVRDNLYFEGSFWLLENSIFDRNEIITAIFQKVQF